MTSEGTYNANNASSSHRNYLEYEVHLHRATAQ